MKTDTFAAYTSAVAAIASAVVAIFALVEAQRQEDIAKQQVQAAYLSNLYSRQTDAYGTLMVSVIDFMNTIGQDDNIDKLDPTHAKVSMSNQLHDFSSYQLALQEKLVAARIVSPDSLEPQLILLSREAQYIKDIVSKYSALAAPSVEDLKAFASDFSNEVTTFHYSLTRVLGCVKPLLLSGQSLSTKSSETCKFQEWPQSASLQFGPHR
jgi:hypothetical protein